MLVQAFGALRSTGHRQVATIAGYDAVRMVIGKCGEGVHAVQAEHCQWSSAGEGVRVNEGMLVQVFGA